MRMCHSFAGSGTGFEDFQRSRETEPRLAAKQLGIFQHWIRIARVCLCDSRDIRQGRRFKANRLLAGRSTSVSRLIADRGIPMLYKTQEDEPSKFARAVSSLLKDPSRRRELGRAARSRVEKQYRVPALREAWRQVACGVEKIGR